MLLETETREAHSKRRCAMEALTLKITGMSCGHCVGQITKVLTRLNGV